jgi:hypothetical protein
MISVHISDSEAGVIRIFDYNGKLLKSSGISIDASVYYFSIDTYPSQLLIIYVETSNHSCSKRILIQ